MSTKRFIIGSRSSQLAMVQTQYVRDTLKMAYPEFGFEIKTIKTTGDRIPDVALSKIGDKGLFTKEIEEALTRREIDLAVHSMKDLPTALPSGLKIAAVTRREDPRDVLVSKQGLALKALPAHAKVGTSSLRRRAQTMHARQDLKILDLRGNLDTRINKLDKGLYDAIIIAHAGIIRLGITVKLSPLSIDEMLPQAGQGALGIEVHEDHREAIDLVRVLDDADSRLSIEAERALLAGLEGGCQVPIGVYAEINGSHISIKAGVFSLDGKTAIRDEISGEKKDAVLLGRSLAEKILNIKAARKVLQDVRKGAG